MYPGTFASTTPDKAAVIMGATGEVITYAELDAEANRLAQLFRAAGLQPGDHVAFCLENHPRFMAVAWGAHYAGLYYTAMSSRLTVEESAYIINDCGAQAFITSAYKADVAAELVDAMPEVRTRLMMDSCIEGFEPYEDAIAAYPAELWPDAVAGRDMLYSSGTTGRPKGVKTRGPAEPVDSPTAVTGLAQLLFGYTDETVYLSTAPLYHAAPLRFTMAVHQVGGTAVVMEHFDPEQALALIERYRVTASQWVPTMFIRMLKLHPNVRARYDLSSLRVAVHAAAPCPPWVKEQMIEWWGPIIDEYYAGSENIGSTWITSEEWLAHRGSVGKSAQGDVHICNADGTELPVGADGLVYFEVAPGSNFEYHDDPAKTASVWHPTQPWRTLGDIGRVDSEQYLYLSDRATFMIISGGANVYPQEIESVLVAHPQVIDAAVVGIPDEDLGEVALAVVQPVPGTDGNALVAELRDLCHTKLAR
ncbi:MAG: AMP-binding protein, partial [Acidimicrobiales bacterium]